MKLFVELYADWFSKKETEYEKNNMYITVSDVHSVIYRL